MAHDLALVVGHHTEAVSRMIAQARAKSFEVREVDASRYRQFYVAIYRRSADGRTDRAVFNYRLFEREPEEYERIIAEMIENIRRTGNLYQFGKHCLMIPAEGGGVWYIDYCDHFVSTPGQGHCHGQALPLVLAQQLSIMAPQLVDRAAHRLHDSCTDELVAYDRLNKAHLFIGPGGGTCAS